MIKSWAVLAVLALLLLAGCTSELPALKSIVPNAAIGGTSTYARGETAHWRIYLSPQDGNPLFQSLGCANSQGYEQVKISVQTYLDCDGQAVSSPNSISTATAGCSYFASGTTSPIVFGGEASATIPASAQSCEIKANFDATRTSNGASSTHPDTTNTGKLLLAGVQVSPLPDCTTGQKMCVGSQPKLCTNGQWQQNEVCPNGCSNGECIKECSIGAIRCISPEIYQSCNSNGFWNVQNVITGSAYCSNGALLQHCSDGNSVSLASSCPSSQPAQPSTKSCLGGSTVAADAQCPASCGDGTCNSGENPQNCLTDCPLPQPTPIPCEQTNPPSCGTPTPTPNPTTCPEGQVEWAGGYCGPASQPPSQDWLTQNWQYVLAGVAALIIVAIGYELSKKN